MSSVVPLGRLEKVVGLRQAWPDERVNFTPWLAQEENLAQLGEAIGLQLEPEAVEKVGIDRKPDRADRPQPSGPIAHVRRWAGRAHYHLDRGSFSRGASSRDRFPEHSDL